MKGLYLCRRNVRTLKSSFYSVQKYFIICNKLKIISVSQLCRTKTVKHINLLPVLGVAMVMLMLLHVQAGLVDNPAVVLR